MAFASKTLTNAKHCYANIEREMLAVVFGAERFRTYMYGRSFTIKSDNKPLISMSQNNLADTPAWLLSLQSMSWVQHSTGYCHSSCLPSPDQKETFQQAFLSNA